MGLFSGIGSLVSAINPVAALGTAASLGSSVLGYQGQKDANDTNLQIAREQMAYQTEAAQKQMDYQTSSAQTQMDFQDKWAQKQMDWQEDLSNSAYQRQMSDMEKAGLNPILASGYSGASTPSGSAPSGAGYSGAGYGGASATMQNEYSSGINLGLDTLSTAADVNKKSAETNQVKNVTKKVKQEIKNLESSRNLTDAQVDRIAYEVTNLTTQAALNAEKAGVASGQKFQIAYENQYREAVADFYKSNKMAAIAKEFNLDARVIKDVINSLSPAKLLQSLLKGK